MTDKIRAAIAASREREKNRNALWGPETEFIGLRSWTGDYLESMRGEPRFRDALEVAVSEVQAKRPKGNGSKAHHVNCPCYQPEETFCGDDDCVCWEPKLFLRIERILEGGEA